MPAGFCELAGVKLSVPDNFPVNKHFTWDDYLEYARENFKENSSDLQANFKPSLAPPHLFSNLKPIHPFKIGQKLEAVDLIQPTRQATQHGSH